VQHELVEIIIAIIGASGVVLAAFATHMGNLKHKLSQAEHEVKFQRAAMGFHEFMQEWGETSKELHALMRETEIDRFIVLRAWNGRLEPRWCTAIYQMRMAGNKPISYIHLDLDDDYRDRLRVVGQCDYIYFDIATIPDSMIKDIYTAEEVKAALWCHLDSVVLSDGSATAVSYCSFATITSDSISTEVILV